jgi:hypothetical protein
MQSQHCGVAANVNLTTHAPLASLIWISSGLQGGVPVAAKAAPPKV